MNRVLLLSLAVVATASAHAQVWTLTNAYAPTNISGDGSTMVGQTGGGWFYWTAATGPVVIGGVVTGTAGISDDGMKIGASAQGPANSWWSPGKTEMAVYDRNTSAWTTYGGHGYYSGTTTSNAWGMSGDGNKVVGQAYYNTTAQGGTAARVNPTVSGAAGGPPVNLDPNTVNNGRVTASNFDGTVVGGYDRGTVPGAIWANGVKTDMITTYNGISGTWCGMVMDISQDGRWVLGSGSGDTEGRGYIYDRTTGTYRFNPVAWTNETVTMHSISADGRFAYGRSLRIGGNPFVDAHLFVWDTTNDNMMSLTDLAAMNGISFGNLAPTLPGGMSADGKTFTGMGYTIGGSATQTFVAHFEAVPEPTTLVVAAVAGVAALARRRKGNKA